MGMCAGFRAAAVERETSFSSLAVGAANKHVGAVFPFALARRGIHRHGFGRPAGAQMSVDVKHVCTPDIVCLAKLQ